MRMRHPRPSSKLVFPLILALAGVLAAPDIARAADQKAALAKIKARYQAAAAAYDDGEIEKTETQLQQALKLAEENGLAEHKLARRPTCSTACSRWPPSRIASRG